MTGAQGQRGPSGPPGDAVSCMANSSAIIICQQLQGDPGRDGEPGHPGSPGDHVRYWY